jgi:deferrochelatase/peroxidase EfeB
LNRPAVTSAARVELDDIQGLVRFAFKRHTEAVFLLLQVKDAAGARDWLARVPVSNATSRDSPAATVLQVALTSAGLCALGADADVINAFSPEFVAGMAGDSSRSRRLGDLGPSDPSLWQWGAGDRIPHVALLIYALPGRLDELLRDIETGCAAGFQTLARLPTSDMKGTEPFGFVDGVSQPQLDWNRERSARDCAQSAYLNVSCLGEFLLGYPNEYGLYTPRPVLDPSCDSLRILPRAEEAPDRSDLGRNGTYLVMRQLRQNVPAFWRAVDEHAAHDARQRALLASALVGRTLGGEPLEPIDASKTAPVRNHDVRQSQLTAFDYLSDPQGLRCPLGAHIRRANPRNADLPPGATGILSRLVRTLGFNAGARQQDLVASTRFHRLLRRGREYGSLLTPEQALTGPPDGADRGLQFICLGANIQRQFEFVQGAWLMNARFNGLQDESDPLLGNRRAGAAATPTDSFSLPQPNGPCRRLTSLPQFITVVGGAYFFLPGIRALRFLSGAR